MIMAKLGVRTVDELVGHTEYLHILPHQITQRAAMVDVSGILARCGEENCHYDPAQHFDFKLDATLDKQGRLAIPPKAVSYAGLVKDVCSIGMGDHVCLMRDDFEDFTDEQYAADLDYISKK